MQDLICPTRSGISERPEAAASAKSSLVLLFLLTGLLLFALPARAQQPGMGSAVTTPDTAVALTPDQARQALDVLRDAARRQEVIKVLEAVAKATPGPGPQSGSAGPQPASGGNAPAGASGNAAEAASAQDQNASAQAKSGQDAPEPEQEVPVSLTSDSLLGQIIAAVSTWLATLSGYLAAAGRTVSSIPLLWDWIVRMAVNPLAQSAVLDAAWRLAAALAGAGIAQWLIRRVLRRPMQVVEGRARTRVEQRRRSVAAGELPTDGDAIASRAELRFLRRLPLALMRLALELAPVGAFAAAGNFLAARLNDGWAVRLIVLAAVNAYVIQHIIMVIGRALVAPGCRELRLFHITDETAAYIEVWLSRVTGVAIYGMAVLEIARILGLYPQAYASASKLIILINHILLIIVVLQCRKGVADLLRAPRDSTSTFAMLRNWLARIWHIPAIFLLLGLWFVWALEVENGYSLLLRYSGATVMVLVVARLVAVALLGLLDRVFRIKPETAQQLPFLEARANRYYPVLRRVIAATLSVVTFLAVLQVWGVEVIAWFRDGGLGERIAGAALVVLIAVIIAVVIWEGANSWMDRQITRMSEAGEYARSARLRTLLPLLRSALSAGIIIVVGFTTLSQLGVNIGPLLAGAGIIGVALGFGSQKLVQDVITGIFLLLENTMQVGDWVTVSGLSGSVENLSVRTIRLRAGDGSVHAIPFSAVTTVTNTNRGIGNAAVSVTVTASEDTDRVGEVLKEIGAELREDPSFRDQILDDFALWGVDKVDGATATVLGQMRCRDTGRWGVQREFNRRIKKRFQRLGIEIAVPAQAVILSRAARQATEAPDARHDTSAAAASGAERHSPPPTALGNAQ
ncbi:mechanosensitive ion channel [Siccirubricoccus sp. KC 17139]|uniref:Mechanosensitive ion channel n=1 Tax=Siccirubricoccus soli TaxID=2899147 RepID=A0ABT1D5Q9_9PROT|nr:mechanosensitive ion channel domain-containing protein [Siccirubricoccus soli]MCO6416549.1 mechanosensitive ion channel [Siccirubricoccus soli]MCP2682684.1 mechanosensitive ion channel [Siccirubricoccus soli]